jgi:glycosyltransferase involved in cell wall biosynthesis
MIKKVFISTYTFINKGIRTNNSGPVVPLLSYFKSKVNEVYLLEQPLPGSDFLQTRLTLLRNGEIVEEKLKKILFAPKKRLDDNKTYLRLKLRDFISNFYFFAKNFAVFKKKKVNLFIGLESVNAICGIIFRKLGLVENVVYYIFDWSPFRYKNLLLNKFYIYLDKIASYYSDYTWNITYTIGEARTEILNYNASKMSPQLYVPYSFDCDETKILSDGKIDQNLVIYSGGLIEENGPQLFLQACNIVAEKRPEAKFLIIGGGGIEEKLKEFVVSNNLQDKVNFTGYIADQEKIMELQCSGAIGVAPYPIMKESRKPFGDVIKIRMYFASGLVVVSTPVPPVSKEIAEEELGYRTTDDSAEEIAKGICLFLDDRDLLFKYRKNVITKAQSNSWEKNYSSALTKMGLLN